MASIRDSVIASAALGMDHKSVLDTLNEVVKGSGLAPIFGHREPFGPIATSTGSLCLDRILGGGIPPGRIIGIAGPERAGKSLLSTEIIRNQLERGGFVVYFDAEGATDPFFLERRGIDFHKYQGKRDKNGKLLPGQVDYIKLYQPTTGEQVRDYMYYSMQKLPNYKSGSFPPVIYILDSVVALVSDAIEDKIDGNMMSMHAKMYAEMLPILNGQIVRTGCSFIYTNQIRLKPGVSYGNPEYEPAGQALKFFSSIRLELKPQKPHLRGKKEDHPFTQSTVVPKVAPKAGGVWEETSLSGGVDKYMYTSIKTVKNKVYVPYQTTWMRIQYETDGDTGCGLDAVYDVFTYLREHELIRPIRRKPSPPASKKKLPNTAPDAESIASAFNDIDSKEEKLALWELNGRDILTPVDIGLKTTTFTYNDLKRAMGDNGVAIVKTLREKTMLSGAILELEDETNTEGTEEDSSGNQDNANEHAANPAE